MEEVTTLSREELLELIEQRDCALTRSATRIASLEAQLAGLQRDYDRLLAERFRARSERYIAEPDQLRLDFGNTPEAADAAAGLADAVEEADLIPAHTRRKPRKTRDESLPAHLPRETVIIDAPEADRICPTHGPKQRLPESMWHRRERLVFVPGTLKVIEEWFIKYACPNHGQCGVAMAELPTPLVEGDKYDASVAAQIIAAKFAFHLPLYRQQDIFAGSGWTPARSTLLNILVQSCFVVEPLIGYFRRKLKEDRLIACDDTGVTLLYPKQPPDFDLADRRQRRAAEVFEQARRDGKPSLPAKMWAYRGVQVPLNVFDFTVSRHRDGPEEFFEGWSGTILGDCWHGFEAISVASGGSILRAACNAHARRKFDKVSDYPADRHRWMGWFQQLYDINAREAGLDAGAKLELRQREARPVWEAMRAELDSVSQRAAPVVLPKSELARALNYLSNHWAELTRYLDDPALPIDNNECEQLMKQAALGRKNWLFAGSLAGGQRSAALMSLVSSAHRNDLDVWAYLDNVLRRLLSGSTDYEPFLPWNWAAAHPQHIRSYRKQERTQRDSLKQSGRDSRRARAKLLAKAQSQKPAN